MYCFFEDLTGNIFCLDIHHDGVGVFSSEEKPPVRDWAKEAKERREKEEEVKRSKFCFERTILWPAPPLLIHVHTCWIYCNGIMMRQVRVKWD